MGHKRHLGLGQAAKSKKSKASESGVKEDSKQDNQITIELDEEVQADDELSQLKALWRTYEKSEKENEFVLNGIVHECDRILRQQETDAKLVNKLPDWFHSVYALSLAELAAFHSTDKKKVSEFFDAAIERAEIGLDEHPDSVELHFCMSRIIIQRIPLQYVSALTPTTKINSDSDRVDSILENSLKHYVTAEKYADKTSSYELFNNDTLEYLEALDDLLDMIDNFGKNLGEGEASDDEDGDFEASRVSKGHPLYSIQSTDKYSQWWRDHILILLENVNKQLVVSKFDSEDTKISDQPLVVLKREICKRIGQSFLQEAEIPSSAFTSMMYDEEFEGVEELDGISKSEAQKTSQRLFKTALKYFELAENKEDPDSWVNIAEAKISLANMYEMDSSEQEELYKEAEKILVKANNVTNDKYADILENLLQN